MHVLIIPSESYIPKESPLSGIFQKVQAHALKRAGYNVGVISPNLRLLPLIKGKLTRRKRGIEITDDNGIPCYKYHSWNWFWPVGRFTSWYWVKVGMQIFERYISERGMPDIVHAHNAIFAGLLAHRIRMRFANPYVITEHSSAFAKGSLSQVCRAKTRVAYKNAAMLITVSESLGRLLESQFGVAVQPWRCIPNVLGREFEEKAIKQDGAKRGGDVFRFLTIGTLREIKGHSDLLRAFKKYLGGNSQIQLRIGGGGPLRGRLGSLAETLEIAEQVVFLGSLSRHEVKHEMNSCDVYVQPSHYETFGVVLIEALACGKPVVSTACGGPESIINDHNGVLVPVENIDALGQAMFAMRDRIDVYDNMRISRKCIARFGEDAVVKQLSGVYSQCICKQVI